MTPQTHAIEQEFPSPEPVAATVTVGAGSVTLIAEDRPSTAVTIDPYDSSEASRSAAEQTTVVFTGDRLTIEAPNNSGGRLFRRGGQVLVSVRLPRGSRVRTQVGSAGVRVEGPLAEAIVTSGSGDVYAAEAGSLTVQTGSGDVCAESVGELKVSTGSGDVTVTSTTGDTDIKTASGDVNLVEAGGTVHTATASGDVHIGAMLGDRVSVSTASGDVELGVPVGTKVWLDLDTVSGSTRSDLAMTEAPADPADAVAVLNVQVRTVSGDIALRRVTRKKM